MEHIAALLLVIGCSGDLGDCREIPVDVPIFETREECRNALREIPETGNQDTPRIMATCVNVDPALVYDDAELVWHVDADGRLEAALERTDVLTAFNTHRASEGLAITQDF